MSDARFDYTAPPNWRICTKQIVKGTDYITLENNNQFPADDTPRHLDFTMDVKRPVVFDMMSRFCVEGSFEVRGADDNAVWEKCEAAEYSDVIVGMNWWETLIKSMEIFHGTYMIKCHSEPPQPLSYLNMCLYWQMDSALKKLLCAESCHTGNAVPKTRNGWNFDQNSDWHKYSTSIFTGRGIRFNWIPLFFFPFYQGSNFVYDEVPPRAVPLNLVGKLEVRMTFKEDFGIIFRKRPGVTKSYRFVLTNMQLDVEEVRLNFGEEKKIYTMNKKLSYAGVTKVCKHENVPNGVFSHTCKFDNVAFPESIFIFAMPQTVIGNTHRFSGSGSNGPHFSQHRIIQVQIAFGGKDFCQKEPNFGTIRSDWMDLKSLYDHIKCGPFGIFTNPEIVTRQNVGNGFENSDFPHVYLPLTASGNRTRIIPLQNDGSAVNKNDDLIINLKFSDAAVAENMVYFFYICYTDANMTLDMKTKKFESPYFIK